MKKKVLAMFLAAAMVVSMAACGSGDSEANQGNDTQQGDDAQEPAGDDAQEPAGDDAQEPAGERRGCRCKTGRFLARGDREDWVCGV